MIPSLLFSLIGGGLVLWAGRRDRARDPRLTLALLLTIALMPLLAMILPKMAILPAGDSDSTATASRWTAWIPIIWAAGCSWQCCRILLAIRTLCLWRNHSREIHQLGRISIRLCGRIESPMAAGILRPMILVPETWQHWSEQQRQAVIAHELTHHRHGDPLWRLLAALACAIHWYHPLVHWMHRRFILQSEFACDAAVIRSGIPTTRYANVLCDLAAATSAPRLCAAMGGGIPLEFRIERLMHPPTPSRRTLPLLMLGGLFAATALCMIERRIPHGTVPQKELDLRLSANPFPGEP